MVSCSRNEYEKKIIGHWNNFPLGGKTDLKFYSDSIVSYEFAEKRTGNWEADSNKIYINYSKKDSLLRNNYTLLYKLSTNKDSLLTKPDSSLIGLSYFVLLRVKDYWNHYLKEINLEIELPIADFNSYKRDSMDFGIDIYVGYKNNKLAVKTYGGSKLESLERISSLVYNIKSTIEKKEFNRLNFNLIVDQKVSEEKIDSIKKILQNFPEIKIFRVYRKDDGNYGKYDITLDGNGWDWYGKYE